MMSDLIQAWYSKQKVLSSVNTCLSANSKELSKHWLLLPAVYTLLWRIQSQRWKAHQWSEHTQQRYNSLLLLSSVLLMRILLAVAECQSLAALSYISLWSLLKRSLSAAVSCYNELDTLFNTNHISAFSSCLQWVCVYL